MVRSSAQFQENVLIINNYGYFIYIKRYRSWNCLLFPLHEPSNLLPASSSPVPRCWHKLLEIKAFNKSGAKNRAEILARIPTQTASAPFA